MKEKRKTETEATKKFTRIVKYNDGTLGNWNYDTSITTKGPVSVDFSYPKGFDHESETEDDNQTIYINPKTGKIVSKARAYQLGLVKKTKK